MRANKILLVVAAGIVSAALAYLGTGLHPIWWAFGWRQFRCSPSRPDSAVVSLFSWLFSRG